MAMDNHHQIAGRIGAQAKWAGTRDRRAATAPARTAFMARFERQVDPDGTMTDEQRAVCAEHALKAHMARLTLARLKKRQERAA